MAIKPKVALYDSSMNLVMYFPAVYYTNAPQTVAKYTEVKGIRGNDSIIVPGSTDSWDLVFKGSLLAADYEALTVLIEALESNFVQLTPYYITLDKTASTKFTYKVKRLTPIDYPDSLRVNFQEYIITAKVNTW